MPNDLARVPKVTSLARPAARSLIAARFLIQRNPLVRSIMAKYKGDTDVDASSKLASELEPVLLEQLEGSPSEAAEAARYLADEYLQIGDAVLIISRDTGMPIARISDENMWQPGLVPRDSGNMATPLARLNPELEGFLVRWTFDRAREEKVVEELATRVATTEYLAKNGDPRLYATTRAGRDIIVEDLRAALPDLIPDSVGGSLGQFIRLLRPGEPTERNKVTSYVGFKAFARVDTGMMDLKARNLFFDVLGSHRSIIAAQWAREIARTLSQLAHTDQEPRSAHYPSLSNVRGLWVAPPDEAAAMRPKFASYFVIPIEGASTFCLNDPFEPIGNIVLGKTDIVQREIHDRWEVAATLEYDLYIEWNKVTPIVFSDLPVAEVVAQIV